MLFFDDFEILSASWTWQRTMDNLWHSANEHAMPLGRLSTWLLIQLAGGPSGLPFVTALQGPLAVLLGMALVYRFVRRELGQPLYGLLAMSLFGVTSQYIQAVSWFSASFSILALDTGLLALLAAQRWRQSGAWIHLVLCAVWSALAPCWFASGILAGPLCFVYLLPGEWGCKSAPGAASRRSRHPARMTMLASTLAPLLGTALFLAVSLPRIGERIMNLEHWRGQTAVRAIHVEVGVAYSLRSTVDNLILGTFGITGVNCPWVVIAATFLCLAVAGWLWWRSAPNRRLILLGLAFIYASYLLIYSARAQWPYKQISVWTRYQLYAHLGLVLILSAGLPLWQNWFRDWTAAGAGRRRWITCLVVVVYFIAQVPRSVADAASYDPQQQSDLEYIERVDAICRKHRISVDTARAALKNLGMGSFQIAGSGETDNGWNFLWGSPDPLPLSVEEAEYLLADIAGQRTTSQPE
jgi:hypothetical protein